MDQSELFKHLRILVVDDSFFNLLIVTQFLERWGITVDTAGNGQEAVDKVKEHRYDMVFMDLQMPEMDGCTATVHIRSMEGGYFKTLPVIALTASPEDHIREAIDAAKITDYLPKPITSEGLFLVIAKYLHND